MGLFRPPAEVPLHPVNPPLAVVPAFIAKRPVTLVLKEKVFTFSGDDFSVKDAATGEPIVRCEGKAFNIRDKKNITGPLGQLLFSLRNRLLTLLPLYIAEDARGIEIFRVKKHLSFGTKMTASFRNIITGQEVELSVKGDMFGMGSTITLNDTIPVANIMRQYANARQILGGQQTYCVTVAPGVDVALIAAICIAFDEAKNER